MITDKNGNILKPGDKVLVEMTVAQVQEHIHESYYHNAIGTKWFWEPNGQVSHSVVLTAEEEPRMGSYGFKGSEYKYFRSLSFSDREVLERIQKI